MMVNIVLNLQEPNYTMHTAQCPEWQWVHATISWSQKQSYTSTNELKL